MTYKPDPDEPYSDLAQPNTDNDLRKRVEQVATILFQAGTSYDPDFHTAPFIDTATQDILNIISKERAKLLDKLEVEISDHWYEEVGDCISQIKSIIESYR
jgi:hypothetical protein